MNKVKVTQQALLPAILCPMCLFFSYGFSIGSINAAREPLISFYNESHIIRYGVPMEPQAIDLLLTFTSSLFPVGGIFGALSVSSLVQKLGRRNLLIYSQLICILGTLLQCISPAIYSYEILIIGRVINGFYTAVGSGIGPIYVNEITPAHIRGSVGSLFSVSIAVGLWVANVLGLEQILGNSAGWPYLFAINAVPGIVLMLFSSWFPETPRTLYLNRGDKEGAVKALQYLRGIEDVSEEMKMLEGEKIRNKGVSVLGLFEILKTKGSRWQLISTIVILASLQLNGINGIQFYLNQVFINAGLPEDIVPYVSIGVITAQIVVTLIGGFLCEKYGRRPLLILSNGLICLSMVVYTLATAFQEQQDWLSYISIVAALGFITGFCTGPGPITFGITPEINDQASRPAAMTWGVAFLWISFSVVAFATPYMFEYLTFAVFIPFLALTILTMAFIYIVVPETKGRSSLSIQAHFAKWNKTPIAPIAMEASQYSNNGFENDLCYTFTSKL